MSSVRDAVRRAEIAQLEKDSATGAEPMLKPMFGAGSESLTRALTQQVGTSPRIRASRVEAEADYEESQRPAVEALARSVAEDNAKVVEQHRIWSDIINSGKSLDGFYLEQTGDKSGCPLLKGFVRDGNPGSDFQIPAMRAAWESFRSSSVFDKYRNTSIATAVRNKIFDFLWNQMCDVTVPGNWAKTLAVLESAHFVLPPLSVAAEETRAQDGKKIAVRDDGSQVIVDGVAYSDQMLNRVTAEEYRKLMQIAKPNFYERNEMLAQQQNQAASDYSSRIVATANGPMSQRALDALTGEEYRRVMGLRKYDSAKDAGDRRGQMLAENKARLGW